MPLKNYKAWNYEMGLKKFINLLLLAVFILVGVVSHPLNAQEGGMSDAYVFLKAAKDRDYSKVKNYLQRGANVNTRSYDDGETALYYAAILKDSILATFLLMEDANMDIPKRSTGETPLMAAVRLKARKIVTMLIGQNCKVNLVDRNGETALFKAVQGNDRETVKKLLEAKADWTIADNTGRTPFDLTLENRRLRSIAKVLKDAGVEY